MISNIPNGKGGLRLKRGEKRNKQPEYEPVNIYDIYEPMDTYPEDTEREMGQDMEYGGFPGPDYPFHDTVERVIGGVTYIVSTECAGKELLGNVINIRGKMWYTATG